MLLICVAWATRRGRRTCRPARPGSAAHGGAARRRVHYLGQASRPQAGRVPFATDDRRSFDAPVSQIASGAPDPIKLGARKMGGNFGSVGTRETVHYSISHGAGVRFRTNCAIPEGQLADLRHNVPACATRVAQRISLGMPRHAVGCGGRTSGAAGRYPGVIEEAFLLCAPASPSILQASLAVQRVRLSTR